MKNDICFSIIGSGVGYVVVDGIVENACGYIYGNSYPSQIISHNGDIYNSGIIILTAEIGGEIKDFDFVDCSINVKKYLNNNLYKNNIIKEMLWS